MSRFDSGCIWRSKQPRVESDLLVRLGCEDAVCAAIVSRLQNTGLCTVLCVVCVQSHARIFVHWCCGIWASFHRGERASEEVHSDSIPLDAQQRHKLDTQSQLAKVVRSLCMRGCRLNA
jgi:hypothetical protein